MEWTYYLVLLWASLWCHSAEAYVPVPFNVTARYGVDGPWQAVTINVGGFPNGTLESAQWTTLNLLPGSYWNSYVLADKLCSGTSDNNCGIGGTWDPGHKQTADDENISWQPPFNSTASDLYATGFVYAQNMNVETSGQSFTCPDSATVAVDHCSRKLPNGNLISCDIGFLSLGADSQQQQFETGDIDADNAYIFAWTVPGFLYNASITTSYSYAMHIGATRYDYAGSLIFGGYDKGRAIGPATTWADDPPQLLDITIGVEVGGSPFDFDAKNGLLLDDTGTHAQLPVLAKATEPYINLPKQTCDNLVQYLPIQYDDNSGYYLWNTNALSYKAITTSSAYLGFIFPPAPGKLEDVTIKVPFQLLILNLTEEASGKPGQTPYFPCMPFTPPNGTPLDFLVESNTKAYPLGRAFLQAALFGRNWNRHISWLAQAPGPGPSRQGMGYQPVDIKDSDTALELYEGETYFRESWSDYWEPLPGSAEQPSALPAAPADAASATADDSELSTGAKAGIGIGVVAVAVAAFGLGAWIFMRRKKSRKDPDASTSTPSNNFNRDMSSSYYVGHGYDHNPEMVQGQYVPYRPDKPDRSSQPWSRPHELVGDGSNRGELAEVPRSPTELDARQRSS